MSDVIKLNSRSSRSTVKVAGIASTSTKEDDSDFIKKQIDESYRSGYKEGQEKARRDLEQDYSNKLIRKYEDVYNILQQYDTQLLDLEKAFEGLVIETAYEIARKIVQREIEDRTIINENVKVAINKVIGANEVRLKLNPTDLQELAEDSKNMIHSSSFTKIKIDPDDRIEKGGCFIETEIGNVDARITTQLTELKKKLQDNL